MAREKRSPLIHARYLAWSGPRVSQINRQAQLGGCPPLDRYTFHAALYRWAIETGRIEEPEERDRPHSAYLAVVFAKDPEVIKNQARHWWQTQIDDYRTHHCS